MRTTASWLNLRTGPGEQYDIVAEIIKGSQVTRVFKTQIPAPNGSVWSWITWGKLHGFVSDRYLEEGPVTVDPAGLWVPRREDPKWMTPRPGWGAKGMKGEFGQNYLKLVVVHHEGAVPFFGRDATIEREIQKMASIDKFHMDKPPAGRGWLGFAYNFCIFPSGRVYQGRGWGYVGAHAPGVNGKSVGVLFPQDGDKQALTSQQILSFKLLMAEGVERRSIHAEWKANGHLQNPGQSTACPGKLIMAQIAQLNERTLP